LRFLLARNLMDKNMTPNMKFEWQLAVQASDWEIEEENQKNTPMYN